MTKLVAYFLPGFHEDSFNNEWWGKGFTEWDNILSSMPLYIGHKQPVMPHGGRYDLSDDVVLRQQFKKIKDAGLDGIAIYDYWSNGERPLKSIIEKIKKDKTYEVAFSICWANHFWTRSWKNKSGTLDILMRQEYSDQKESQFKHYAELFQDERYIKVDGRPFFQIYKPEDIPDLSNFIEEMKEWMLKKTGLIPHVSGMVKSPRSDWGFLESLDSITIHNPTACLYSPVNLMDDIDPRKAIFNPSKYIRSLPLSVKKILYKIEDFLPKRIEMFDYDKLIDITLKQTGKVREKSKKRVYSSIFVGFDNSPRYKKKAKIVNNVTEEAFERGLRGLISSQSSDDIVFINAWNEWGEGMALEVAAESNLDLTRVIRNI